MFPRADEWENCGLKKRGKSTSAGKRRIKPYWRRLTDYWKISIDMAMSAAASRSLWKGIFLGTGVFILTRRIASSFVSMKKKIWKSSSVGRTMGIGKQKTPVLVKRAFLHLWTASASPWAHHLQWVFFRRLLGFKSQKSTKVKSFRIWILKLCHGRRSAVCSQLIAITISTLLNIENFRAIMHTSAPIN